MLRFKLFLAALGVFIFSAVSSAYVTLDRIAAVVNKEVITWSELYRTMESDAAPQLKELKEEEKAKVFKENEASFLETMINVKLQIQEARDLGIRVSDEETNEAIENIKKKYSMSDADFKESLKKEGYSFEEYRKRLQEQIVINKVVNQVIKSKIVISEEDIKKYMQENKEAVETADSYRISQILFKQPKNDEEKNIIQEKVNLVLKKLKDGESFKELAKQYSQDVSAGAGGDLGLIKRAHLNKEFSDVISKMKPGEFSSPFWTEKGLHIIRLEERAEHRDPNEIKEEVRNALGSKLFLEKYNAWIKGLREKSFIEIRL